jgi:hypothetical protein
MNKLLQYLLDFWRNFERGEVDNFPDPDPPADLGDPLTQDEIDFVKKLKKEMDERFTLL